MNTHRLSNKTHEFCRRAMSGEFGRQTEEHFCAIIDDPAFAEKTPYEQYNACVKAIVN